MIEEPSERFHFIFSGSNLKTMQIESAMRSFLHTQLGHLLTVSKSDMNKYLRFGYKLLSVAGCRDLLATKYQSKPIYLLIAIMMDEMPKYGY